ncbi:MAG: DMT family transporter [Kiritimatiellia bacterium]|nr:DMT family transporter [Lentisphaerota bacterium]
MKKNVLWMELLLFAVALVWAVNFSVAKVALAEIDPMSFNALRFVMAAGLVWGIIAAIGQWRPLRRRDWPELISLSLLGSLLYQLLFIFGLQRTFSSNAAVMVGTIPVWVAVLSHLFTQERMNRKKALGVALAFSGVVLILCARPEGVRWSSASFVGDLLTLAAAVAFAGYTVISKRCLHYYPPLQLAAISMSIGGASLVVAGLPSLLRLPWRSISWVGYAGVVYSGLFSLGLAYVIWNYGLQRVGAVRTATYQNMVPVMGLVLGMLVLGEKMAPGQLLGALVVIAGIIQTRRR